MGDNATERQLANSDALLSEAEKRNNLIRLAFGGDEKRFDQFCSIVREGVPEAHAPDRGEQVLPPDGPEQVRESGNPDREGNQVEPGALDLRPHLVQVGVAQEEREQANREQRDERRAE